MTHRLVRCEHCRTEYAFQASGEGCNNILNNEHYCPECMQKIIEALKEIPVKYSERYNEIEITKDILDKFGLLKKEKENIGGFILNVIKYVNLGYEHIELYTIDFIEYALCWDNESDKHLFRLDEYDNIKKEFTGRCWRVNKKNGFCFGGNLYRTMKEASNIPERPITQPTGNLFFMDMK